MTNIIFLKKVLKIVSFYFLFLFFVGCGYYAKDNRPVSNISQATGRKINAKGFGYNLDFQEQGVPPGLVFIEGGTFIMGAIQDDVMHDWNAIPRRLHVQSFYIDETEVTNLMYLEYLQWLKNVFPPSNADFKHIYPGALPDTLVWRSPLGNLEDLVNYYLRHPAFAEYPVVGVSWRQATEFAKWRTNRVNEKVLEDAGYIMENQGLHVGDHKMSFDKEAYIASPERTYNGEIDSLQGKLKKDSINVFAKIGAGILLPDYRLPTEAEWEYAAGSFTGQKRLYNIVEGKGKYPWRAKYTRSTKFRTMGDQLANFKLGKGDYGGVGGWSEDKGDITVRVASFPPNNFGLYDMAGNVSEWVADVYRPVIDEAADINYFRGNVYKEPSINEDGSVKLIDLQTIEYDTLKNGRIMATSLPGEVKKEPLKVSDFALRPNFSRENNIDYGDGDKNSGRYYRDFNSDAQQDTNKRMYNSPVTTTNVNEEGNIVIVPDKSNKRTTLVSDDVRVYKGGSWKDRAYWLEPGQRRYFPEYLATDDIGFRLAMSRVGSKIMGAKTRKPKTY